MKKILILILTLSILLGLCACGGNQSGGAVKSDFLVGFGRTSITPQISVPLAGYGNTSTRYSKEVLNELYATCIAMTDAEGNTILLISQDIIGSYMITLVRPTVSQATGVPQERIFLAGTHTHSAPDQQSKQEAMSTYNGYYLRNVVEAAKMAMEDRVPAIAATGSVEVENMNFVRHYLMNDGTYAGDNFGEWDSGIKDYAEPNDPQLQVIKFTRQGKKDVVMVNWQVHPKLTGGTTKYDVSSDFIGYTRDYVEQKTDSLMVYFTGAAGNQNPTSRIQPEIVTKDAQLYGTQIGDYVLRALEQTSAAQTGTIKTKKTDYVAQVDLLLQDKMDEAKEVQALYKEKGRDEGNKLARQYGFSSVYHANAVINRKSYGKSQKVEVNAVSLGSIGFVTAAYEMFASHGAAIKAASPFDTTFVITCCNGGNGYIPTQQAHDYGCYESHTGRFVPGTGEELVQVLSESLTELKK